MCLLSDLFYSILMFQTLEQDQFWFQLLFYLLPLFLYCQYVLCIVDLDKNVFRFKQQNFKISTENKEEKYKK